MKHSYKTSRLHIYEALSDISDIEKERLLNQTVEILTPAVVKALPPYFHNINTRDHALTWFDRMISESRLFVITPKDDDSAIGFLFVHTNNNDDTLEHEAHIGYLLRESSWGSGLAKELLTGFIEWTKKAQIWHKLVGGVDRTNTASLHLLKKLGFSEQSQPDSDNSDVVFYELSIS